MIVVEVSKYKKFFSEAVGKASHNSCNSEKAKTYNKDSYMELQWNPTQLKVWC